MLVRIDSLNELGRLAMNTVEIFVRNYEFNREHTLGLLDVISKNHNPQGHCLAARSRPSAHRLATYAHCRHGRNLCHRTLKRPTNRGRGKNCGRAFVVVAHPTTMCPASTNCATF